MKQTLILTQHNPNVGRYFRLQMPLHSTSLDLSSTMFIGSRPFTSSAKLPMVLVPDKVTKTFQEVIFKYLSQSSFENVIQQETQFQYDLARLDNFFKEKCNRHTEPITSIDPNFSLILPAYISTMRNRKISTRLVTVIDHYCHEILEFESYRDQTLSSLELLNAWLKYFNPHFHRFQELLCYGKLIRIRGREVFQNILSSQEETISSDRSLIHLAFVAGIGKKNLFESHEVLNQLGTLCDTNPEITYRNWNPFDLAVVCVSFFKGGIKMDSKRFLSHISEALCQILSEALASESEIFNPYVVISLLKILRQANYVEEKLLRLLSELILSPNHEEQVRSISFLTNVVSAVTGPRKQSSQSLPSALSVVKVLNRIEQLVGEIIRDEENVRRMRGDPNISLRPEEVDSTTKSRLKDISRWFWATASLGYQISPEDYQADLSRRFFSGEFSRRPSDAVDALLALAIMNHYLDGIVMKVLHSQDFRSAIRVKCLQRHKGRFGLLLTSLKIERNDLWRQLSPRDVFQLMEIVGPPKSETEGWSPAHLPIKKKRDRASINATVSDFKPHSVLLNQCMDALNVIFTPKRTQENNDSRNDNSGYKITIDASSSGNEYQGIHGFSQMQVLQGYAVPYLHIPGIKVILPNVGKELCLEVVEEETILPGLHKCKLRLMSQMGYIVLTITPEEIKKCPDLLAYLQFNIKRNLNL